MAAVEVVMENPSGGPNHKTPTSGGVSISRRSKKAVIESDSEDESSLPCGGGLPPLPPLLEGSGSSTINYSMDISQLEAPTFTTLERGPSASMTSLAWDHGVNLIGKKVLNPMIHCCDKCLKPILIYGRMIPCKHVFCLKCAQGEKNGSCSRCGDKVSHVDHAGLGSIYMCSHGGSRYGNNGCRRTYLSQRDLQAHIRHRHLKAAAAAALQQQHEHTRPPSALSSSNHQGPLHPPPPPTNNHSPAPPTMTGPNNSSGTPTRLLSATAAPPLLKVPPGEVYANPRANPSSSYSSPRTTLHPPLNPAGPPPPTQQQQQLNQPISVISSNRTASNLITVPIIEGESSGANGSGPPGDHYGSSYNYNGAPYYPTHYSHPPPNYPPSPAVVPTDPYYSPHNYESAYNGNTAYRTTNNPSGNPPSSYYRR